MEKIALVPAYQPEGRLIKLAKKLKALGFVTVVVDDGSGKDYDDVFDSTAEYAAILRYEPNRGKGEALRYGLRFIKEQFKPPYTVVTADSDGQHRTEDIVKVSGIAEQHPDSLVLGKRLLDKSSPIKSRIGNGLTRGFYHLFTGRYVYETQTGLRAFSDRQLERFLQLPGHRYEYEIDMMLVASDIDIIETEIQTVYFDNNANTHFRPIEDTVSLNKEFFRYKLPSLIAAAADYLLFILLYLPTGSLLANIGARALSFGLKYLLNRTIFFAEKASIGRYLITSSILLILDTAAIWGLCVIGVNVYIAKLLSGILMIAVGALIRKIFMTIQYRK